MTDAPGLRELKKRQTRAAISRAALELTVDRPYAEVTVAEIAAAAGVSRRTVSNYFSSKAECFAGAVGGEFISALVGQLLAQETGGMAERLSQAFRGIDHRHWEDVRQLHTIARTEPDVAAAIELAERTESKRLADALVEASDNRIDPLRLSVTIAAISSCISVNVEYWLDTGARGGPGALADLVASSLDILNVSWLEPHLDAIRRLFPQPSPASTTTATA